MNHWRDYITHEMDVCKELDAQLNFLKINFMSRWVKQFGRSGAFQQYSAERHEQAHKMNLKDCWNASNHNLNYLPQVITFQRRILCFKIRHINLQAIAQRRENSAATCNVLPSDADLAATLSSQPYVMRKFMGPQNSHDERHSNKMSKDFRALLDNTQDATHCVTIYKGMWVFIKDMSHNKTFISYEQLHAMELYIYHGIKVQIEDLEGESRSQIC